MVTIGGIYLDSNKTSEKVNLEVYTHPLFAVWLMGSGDKPARFHDRHEQIEA